MADERLYYEPVRKWLTGSRGYYTGGGVVHASGPNKGEERVYTRAGRAGLQADVLGLKFIGSEVHSDVEVCVVEVKDTGSITHQHINQAVGYRVFAHRVYLAAPTAPKSESEEMLRLMHTLGIGYLRLCPKKKNVLSEVQGASFSRPDDGELLRLLRSLWIIRCTLCRCYFPYWDTWMHEKKKTYLTLRRPRVPSTSLDPSTIQYNTSVDKKHQIERYLCFHCQKDLKLLLGQK